MSEANEVPEVEVEEAEIEVEVDEKDEQIAQLQQELGKLKNKEYNFKKLRDMTETEIEGLSAKEKELIERTERLEERETTHRTRVVEGHKQDAFAVLAGDNEELLKKMELHYNRISDDAVTQDEINKKAKDAFLLATDGAGITVDPIVRAAAHQRGHGISKPSNKLTNEQKDLAAKMGISEEDFKKYSN